MHRPNDEPSENELLWRIVKFSFRIDHIRSLGPEAAADSARMRRIYLIYVSTRRR